MKRYLDAAEPEFSVGEFWDTCTYEGSGLAYNQVSPRLTPPLTPLLTPYSRLADTLGCETIL